MALIDMVVFVVIVFITVVFVTVVFVMAVFVVVAFLVVLFVLVVFVVAYSYMKAVLHKKISNNYGLTKLLKKIRHFGDTESLEVCK